jgi:serine/threonine-protein kinase
MPDHGRYRVLRKLADGGMAEIFLGAQRGAAGFERAVVLKRIRPDFAADPQFRDALIDEAHIAMTLQHSNIVQVLDLGAAKATLFLALEFVDGWDLDRLRRRAEKAKLPLPAELALFVVIETCRALAYAHTRARDGKPLGIVHRDISPHNILVSEQGEVKLTDFGIATARTKRTVSQVGSVKGKIGFMSPEQASGLPVDARSDLFALGTTLYLLTTGRLPFVGGSDGKTLALTRKAEFADPQEACPGIAPELAGLITRAMKREASDRFESAEAMLHAAEQVQRTALGPAGQSELKQWLAQLSALDGGEPAGRAAPAPQPEQVEDELILGEAEPSGQHPRLPPAPPPDASLEALERTEQQPVLPARRGAEKGRLLLLGGGVTLSLFAGLYGSGLLDRWAGVPPTGAPMSEAMRAAIAPAPDSGPTVAMSAFNAPLNAGPTQSAAPPLVDAGAVEQPATALAPGLSAIAPVATAEAALGPGPDAGEPGTVRVYLARREPPLAAGDDVIYVQLLSSPSGATVVVNGKSYGETPGGMRFRALLTYDVEVSKPGYAPLKARVYLPRRNGQVMEATLLPR